VDKNMREPLVSVVMPVYNAEKYVKESVESILNQTYKNFELIVIDDGSKDKSFEIVAELAAKDKRIKLLKNDRNLGVSATRNKCIDFSDGEYVALMDSDDISLPKRLEKQVAFLSENRELGLLGSSVEVINEAGEIVGVWKYPETHDEISVEMIFSSPFASSSVIIRRDAVTRVKYNEDLIVAEDYDFYSRLSKNTKTHNLKDTLVKYRINSKGLTRNNLSEMENKSADVAYLYLNSQRLNLGKTYFIELRKLMSGKTIEKDNMLKIEQHLLDIKRQLVQNTSLSNQAINSVFQEKWFNICKKGAYNGMSVYRHFFESDLFKSEIDIFKKIKFFIKCFLRLKLYDR
jgi:glycosyltransferase involved in cell wall biosynthesis